MCFYSPAVAVPARLEYQGLEFDENGHWEILATGETNDDGNNIHKNHAVDLDTQRKEKKVWTR